MELSNILVGMQMGTVTLENNLAVSYKVKYTHLPYALPAFLSLNIYSIKNKIYVQTNPLKEFHRSFIHNTTKM